MAWLFLLPILCAERTIVRQVKKINRLSEPEQTHLQGETMDISRFRNGNSKRRIQGTGSKAALGVLFSLGLISWTAWENASLEITEYVHHDSQIPEPFSGFRIAHVTDLHNSVYGKHNVRLLEALRGTKPDCIFITGDLVDSRNTNLPIALDFVRRAADIAPIYYVPGNHESRLRGQYAQLVRGLKEYGVNVLANQTATLFRGKERICLIGADDPGFQIGDDGDLMKSSLSKLAISEESLNILLVHRPELFPVYSDFPIDLVFSGHSHGGQIRIPHLGGVYVPCQGFFPTYDAGKFTKNGTTMYISRGLARIPFLPRIHNRPELLVVELRRE